MRLVAARCNSEELQNYTSAMQRTTNKSTKEEGSDLQMIYLCLKVGYKESESRSST